MKKLLLVFLIISMGAFAQTTIVNDGTDQLNVTYELLTAPTKSTTIYLLKKGDFATLPPLEIIKSLEVRDLRSPSTEGYDILDKLKKGKSDDVVGKIGLRQKEDEELYTRVDDPGQTRPDITLVEKTPKTVAMLKKEKKESPWSIFFPVVYESLILNKKVTPWDIFEEQEGVDFVAIITPAYAAMHDNILKFAASPESTFSQETFVKVLHILDTAYETLQNKDAATKAESRFNQLLQDSIAPEIRG